MPIRFRCAYCNQLMGISKRKAGTVVRCPKCAGEIIVPVPEGTPGADAPEPPEAPEPQAPAPVFENQNFEQAFNVVSSVKESASAPAPVETVAPPAEIPPLLPPPPAAPPKRLGLFLSVPMLIVCLGVIVLLLILMFALGLIIGIQARPAPDTKSAAASGLVSAPIAVRRER